MEVANATAQDFRMSTAYSAENAEFTPAACCRASKPSDGSIFATHTFVESFSSIAFLQRVSGATGLSPIAGGQLVSATLRSLCEQLSADAIAVLSRALPPTLAIWIENGRAGAAVGADHFLSAVKRESAEWSFDRSHVSAVCRLLAELLPKHAVTHLRAQLTHDVWSLFE